MDHYREILARERKQARTDARAGSDFTRGFIEGLHRAEELYHLHRVSKQEPEPRTIKYEDVPVGARIRVTAHRADGSVIIHEGLVTSRNATTRAFTLGDATVYPSVKGTIQLLTDPDPEVAEAYARLQAIFSGATWADAEKFVKGEADD